ncbi:MAG TPA: DMT family transporter [Candidatus Limnocylindrales bacterium]|nr:DMT family transporter [Candidatus Limnocylindrales bacterium]
MVPRRGLRRGHAPHDGRAALNPPPLGAGGEPRQEQYEERLGVALTIAAALLWGTSWVATGFALRGFSPFAAAAWRGIGAAVLLALALRTGLLRTSGWRTGGEISSRGRLVRLIVLGLCGGSVFAIGLSLAVDVAGATMAAFIAGLYPLLAAAGSGLVTGERPAPIVYGGVLAAFVGVLLMAGFDPAGLPLDGVVVALVAAVAFAAYLLLARRWSVAWDLPAPLVALSLYAMLALAATPLALLAGGGSAPLDGLLGGLADPSLVAGGLLVPLVGLAWTIGPAGALAQSLAIAGVRRLPAHASSPYLLLNPLAAAVLAALLLGERLALPQVAGAALILAGIGLATVIASPARPAPAAEGR